jgi:hypothetical protein
LMTSTRFQHNRRLHLRSSKHRTCANIFNNGARELLRRGQHGIARKCRYLRETIRKFSEHTSHIYCYTFQPKIFKTLINTRAITPTIKTCVNIDMIRHPPFYTAIRNYHLVNEARVTTAVAENKLFLYQ